MHNFVLPHYLKAFTVVFAFLFVNHTRSQIALSEHIISFTLEAPQLNTKKTIWIYLPESYADSKNTYPVIYMHDGQNLFDPKLSYAGEWMVDDYLDTISENESIVVGIAHGNEKRIDELTPFPHEKHGGGKGDTNLDFIFSDLMPHVEKNYRVKTGPENTAIFGSSLGGLISFYAAVKYHDVFGKAGVFSPSFWINPEIYDMVKENEIQDESKFYFLVGTEEGDSMVADMEKMVTLLNEKGVSEKQISSHIIKGEKHNEGFWAKYFPEAYEWLMTND